MSIPIPLKAGLAGLAVALGASALVALHLDNRRLQRRIEEHQKRSPRSAAVREENAQLSALLASNARDAAAAAAGVQAQVQRAREEIAALEKRARDRHAGKVAEAARLAEMLATNRDPTKGLVRLENFENSGQATPVAACETLVWAALKGDDAALAKVCTMSRTARAQMEALIARLPGEDARARWTPEKLATLWVTGALADILAAQVVSERFADPRHATVTFRTQADEVEKVKLTLGASGWEVVVPGNAIDKLGKKLGVAPP